MNDYFDNLVAKTLGLARVAQPRLAALFEPLDLSSQPAADVEPTPGVEWEPPTRAEAEPPSTARLERDDPIPENMVATLLSPPPVPAPATLPPGALTKAANNETRLPGEPVFPRAPNPANLVLPAPASGHQTLSMPIAPQPERSSQPAQDAAHARSQAPSATALRPSDSQTPEVAPSERLLIAPRISLDSSRLEGGPAEPPPSAFSAAPEPAPTIKITIGRVDVRAVIPPKEAPRPAPERRPALSLDDYLKRRSGGQT